jgi:hypothetical protein
MFVHLKQNLVYPVILSEFFFKGLKCYRVSNLVSGCPFILSNPIIWYHNCVRILVIISADFADFH